MPDPRDFLPPPPWEGPPVPRAFTRASENPQRRRFPVAWDIRIEHPDVDDPKWEGYKRLVEYLKRRRLRGRPSYESIVIEDIPTQAMVDEIKSVVESYSLKVIGVTPVELIPEEPD